MSRKRIPHYLFLAFLLSLPVCSYAFVEGLDTFDQNFGDDNSGGLQINTGNNSDDFGGFGSPGSPPASPENPAELNDGKDFANLANQAFPGIATPVNNNQNNTDDGPAEIPPPVIPQSDAGHIPPPLPLPAGASTNPFENSNVRDVSAQAQMAIVLYGDRGGFEPPSEQPSRGGGVNVNSGPAQEGGGDSVMDDIDNSFFPGATTPQPGSNSQGGGIYNQPAEGGGLWNNTEGTMTIKGSTINGNQAGGAGDGVEIGGDASDAGGGVFNHGGTLTIENSTISGNQAVGGDDGVQIQGNPSSEGGGIWNGSGAGAAIPIGGSTITNNTASAEGGGLWNSSSGTLTIENSTISGNQAVGGDDGVQIQGNPSNEGGGLWNGSGTGAAIPIGGSTITNNTASAEGGGLWNNGGGTLTVTNTTITGNQAGGSGDGVAIGGDSAASPENPAELNNAGDFAKLANQAFPGIAAPASPGNQTANSSGQTPSPEAAQNQLMEQIQEGLKNQGKAPAWNGGKAPRSKAQPWRRIDPPVLKNPAPASPDNPAELNNARDFANLANQAFPGIAQPASDSGN